MRRRQFITLLGGAAVAWPLAARAQQPAGRTIGWLSARSISSDNLTGFRQGLSETGYVEGKNLTIDYRWAEGQYDRLQALAADLVRGQVAVIVTAGGPQVARAAQAATSTIPIVFQSGSDPVQDGLVKNFNRPSGNTTGVQVFTTSLGPKRLGLLRELIPRASVIAFLVNPSSQIADMQIIEVQEAARSVGQGMFILNASTEREIDLAFETLVQRGASALLMSADLFFQVHRDQLVALEARYKVPVMYEWPEFVAAGGLISYSTALTDSMLQMGIYVGRILNGAKPADLPVVQATRFELVINLQTARAIGIEVPPSLLSIADEVIE
jgi:putative tryptophan/tyrosine transport system substrate-binding protein